MQLSTHRSWQHQRWMGLSRRGGLPRTVVRATRHGFHLCQNGPRAVQAAAISSDEDSDDDDLTWRFVSEQTHPQPRSPDEGAGPSGHGSSSWAFVDINDPRNKHVLDKLAAAWRSPTPSVPSVACTRRTRAISLTGATVQRIAPTSQRRRLAM
eukprot:scaffold61356_cov98-Phaeocystis_antarctica.AAC.1